MYNDIVKRLSRWASGQEEAPQRVLLYPTNQCNLNCVFCYQRLRPYDYSIQLPKRKWFEITEGLCDMGVKTLQISGGGEPLLKADTVVSMMKLIKKRKVEGRLVTNGTLFTSSIIKSIISMQWDHVIFSIDGEKAKTHDFLRGTHGSFNETVRAIELFTNLKKENYSEKPLLEFSSVLTNKNYKQIQGIIKLAYKLGVKVITFEPVFISNPEVHKLKMNSWQRKRFVKQIPSLLKFADSLDIITNLEALHKLNEVEKTGNLKEKIINNEEINRKNNEFLNIPCYDPWLWPKIEADGRIGPCSSILFNDMNIKDSTFRDVWYGATFTEFRKRIQNKDLPGSCANCVSTHIPLNNAVREKLREVIHDTNN